MLVIVSIIMLVSAGDLMSDAGMALCQLPKWPGSSRWHVANLMLKIFLALSPNLQKLLLIWDLGKSL